MKTNTKRLRISERDSILFGVAGGMAEYFDIDPTLVRAVWVILVLASAGTALIAYIALAIIMPKHEAASGHSSQAADESADDLPEDAAEVVPHNRDEGRWTAGRKLLGLMLIALGGIFLLSNLGIFSWWRWDVFWPLILIGIGAALIFGRFMGGGDD
ncbi:MAG: PspC domain-containing protein [Chloroflexi bacterium]|nr:PspC domain-containing protein [Chloroflexota bacterium]